MILKLLMEDAIRDWTTRVAYAKIHVQSLIMK